MMDRMSFNDITGVTKKSISYNDIVSKSALFRKKIKLSAQQKLNLIGPYFTTRFWAQLKVVIPIGVYLLLFQMLILRVPISHFFIICLGLLFVCVGLMFFMEGLDFGLMPFAEAIGNTMPQRISMFWMMFIVFLIGVATTFSEPAIGALQAMGSIVKPSDAPYLYSLLNFHVLGLTLVVGFGVGLAAVIGVMRFVYGWSLKPLIYMSLVPLVLLTLLAMFSSDMRNIYALAWDCGAVTTGPVTVPIVLALGVGVASSTGESSSSLSGFGIVTLASLFPIIAVLIFCFIIFFNVDPSHVLAQLKVAHSAVHSASAWFDQSPYQEAILGLRAVIPLLLLLGAIFFMVLHNKLQRYITLVYGLVVVIGGIVIFNIGLTYGLQNLGQQTGQVVPSAFIKIEQVASSPLYHHLLGLSIVGIFIFFMGFGATMAEPALNALGITVERLTNGVMRKSSLIYSVAGGVGVGLAIGVLKIIFHIPLGYLAIPFYMVAVILTYFSSEEFVNVAWDSAGVTTGPITVPLVLATGLGISLGVKALDGFGVLAMASVCPIIAVLSSGLIARYRATKSLNREES